MRVLFHFHLVHIDDVSVFLCPPINYSSTLTMLMGWLLATLIHKSPEATDFSCVVGFARFTLVGSPARIFLYSIHWYTNTPYLVAPATTCALSKSRRASQCPQHVRLNLNARWWKRAGEHIWKARACSSVVTSRKMRQRHDANYIIFHLDVYDFVGVWVCLDTRVCVCT